MSSVEKPARPWQEIAAEASHEQDSKRLIELAQELERALDDCDKPSEGEFPANTKSA